MNPFQKAIERARRLMAGEPVPDEFAVTQPAPPPPAPAPSPTYRRAVWVSDAQALPSGEIHFNRFPVIVLAEAEGFAMVRDERYPVSMPMVVVSSRLLPLD